MRLRSSLCSLLALAAAGSLLLAGCKRAPPEPPPPTPPAPVAEAPPAAPPAATLSRAELLSAMEAEAAAYSAGRPGAGETLAGRRFVVRQAFGCEGPAADGPAGLARWTPTKDGEGIEFALSPADWSSHPVFTGVTPAWEAVEGFWLARPWLPDEACPPRLARAEPLTSDAPTPKEAKAAAPSAPSPAAEAPAATPEAPSPQTAGLAAVFAHGGSRVGRRDGKPFAFTLRDEPAPPAAPADGFRLVLEGRLTAFPDGRAIRCQQPSPDVRPVCIAAAELDRVAFEAADGRLLREWRPG